jgi:hypothetical protein
MVTVPPLLPFDDLLGVLGVLIPLKLSRLELLRSREVLKLNLGLVVVAGVFRSWRLPEKREGGGIKKTFELGFKSH